MLPLTGAPAEASAGEHGEVFVSLNDRFSRLQGIPIYGVGIPRSGLLLALTAQYTSQAFGKPGVREMVNWGC